MEIMGLMIIVILLIVGVLFALKFVVLKKPTEVRQTYTRTQLASNLGIAMMSSTTDCRDTAVRTLLIDCAENYALGGGINCGGVSSCDYVDAVIADILNRTVDQWGTKYYLIAAISETTGERIIEYHTEDCDPDNERPGESETFFLPITGDLLTLKIFICY
ncbi:hypothetical protein KY362_03330 [Candidatus Woesearchaeota archaeon]|nr:hypothetical protein [Candidatus Woesearchaeota archaeon]